MAAQASPEPSSTSAASKTLATYDLVIGLLAILSLIVLALINLAPLSSSTKEVLLAFEDFLCIIFLLDFLRSLYRAPRKWGYFLRGGGWLDLLGSIPLNAFALFRIFRLFRIIRAGRALRSSDWRKMLTERIAESALLFTLVVAMMLIFLIGGIVTWAERGAPNANILTYPEGVWWAVVTITTVGYGDYFPVTAVGRISATILMFCGLGIIGVLSSYLATTFLSLQARRGASARTAEEAADQDAPNHEGGSSDQEVHDTATGISADLAAIRQELTALRRLLEQHVRSH